MKWTLVAFNHPDDNKSIAYRQGLDFRQLIAAMGRAVEEGANLFSIRGFEEAE